MSQDPDICPTCWHEHAESEPCPPIGGLTNPAIANKAILDSIAGRLRPSDDPEYLRELGKLQENASRSDYNASRTRGHMKRYWTAQANRWRAQMQQLARAWYESHGQPIPAELREARS